MAAKNAITQDIWDELQSMNYLLPMKKSKLLTIVLLAIFAFAPLGCKKEPADNDAAAAGDQTQKQEAEHTHEPGEESDHEH